MKGIQNKKRFVKPTFTDIKSYLILVLHNISSYLFIVLTKTTKDEQDYLQFSVQPEKEP